jgi:hypothetical protein
VTCRGCIVGTRGHVDLGSQAYARYDLDIFGAKDIGITDIMFDFEDIQNMFRLKELSIEIVRLWCIQGSHQN